MNISLNPTLKIRTIALKNKLMIMLFATTSRFSPFSSSQLYVFFFPVLVVRLLGFSYFILFYFLFLGVIAHGLHDLLVIKLNVV